MAALRAEMRVTNSGSAYAPSRDLRAIGFGMTGQAPSALSTHYPVNGNETLASRLQSLRDSRQCVKASEVTLGHRGMALRQAAEQVEFAFTSLAVA
jgi:hypothetical protein